MGFIEKALRILGEIGDNRRNLGLLEPHFNKLVPFVGAGLSAGFGYPDWKELLRGLATTPALLESVNEFVAVNRYEEAAQILHDYRRTAFNDALADGFDDNKMKRPIREGSAVYYLAHLARGPVLTTNFDRVLEAAFDDARLPFAERFEGSRIQEATRALNLHLRCLLKIHGDYLFPSTRVFTLTEYAGAYGSTEPGKISKDSPLPKILELAIGANPLLFLGCSLQADRTTLIIANVAKRWPGIMSFALLSDHEKTPERLRQLDSWNIRPIFYPRGVYRKIAEFLACIAENVDPVDPSRGFVPQVPEEVERMLSEVREANELELKRIKDQKHEDGKVQIVGLEPPPALARFIGREQELKDLAAIFLRPEMRIVTILGTSGMGKTAVARKLFKEFSNSASALSLRNLVGVAYLSAQTAGISFRRLFFDCARLLSRRDERDLTNIWYGVASPEARSRELISRMQGGHFLILLDNLETELDTTGLPKDHDLSIFFAVLRTVTEREGVRILITSHAPVHLSGGGDVFNYWLRSGLTTEEAMEVMREFDAQRPFHFLGIPAFELRNVLRGMDAIPRALELVTSLLMHGKPLEEVQALIVDAHRDHQKLVELLSKANYKVLSDGAKRVLEAMATFDFPMPIAAIAFMLARTAPYENVDEIIAELRETHTVTRENYEEIKTSKALISLHPTDRNSILAEVETIERRRLNLQAADYFSKVSYEHPWVEPRQIEPQQQEIEHRARGQDFIGALNALNTICYSWRTNHHKYLAYLKSFGLEHWCVEQRQSLAIRLKDAHHKVHNNVSLGWLYRRMGKIQEANLLLADAVEQARGGSDPGAKVFALSEYGYFLTDNYDAHAEAKRHLLEAETLVGASGDDYARGHILLGLSFTAFQDGSNEQAESEAKKARDAFASVKTRLARFREIDCLVRLGLIYRKTGMYTTAIGVAKEGFRIAQEHGLTEWEAELKSALAFNYRALFLYSEALESQQDALNIFESGHNLREIAVQHSYIANLLMEMGSFDLAKTEYAEATRIIEYIRPKRESSWIKGNRGVLFARLGELEAAERLQREAIDLLDAKHADSRAVRLTDLAYTQLLAQQYASCLTSLQEAVNGQPLARDSWSVEQTIERYRSDRFAEDTLPHEMHAPFAHERRGLILARIFLNSGDYTAALTVLGCAKSPRVEHPRLQLVKVMEGVCLLRMGEAGPSRERFLEALQYAAMPQSGFERSYTQGLAFAGLTLSTSPADQPARATAAKAAYTKARNLCGAAGVVRDARNLLSELTRVQTGEPGNSRFLAEIATTLSE